MDDIDRSVITEPEKPDIWYARPYLLSDGNRDWRVGIHGRDGEILFALYAPSKRKAEALAARLNRVVAWLEVSSDFAPAPFA